MPQAELKDNKAIAILEAAEQGNYGVPGVVSVSLLLSQASHSS